MNIASLTFEPPTAGPARERALLSASWRHFTDALSTVARQRRIARALRSLSDAEDYALNDMGLSRSDLTPQALARTSALRALRQMAIDAEIATRR